MQLAVRKCQTLQSVINAAEARPCEGSGCPGLHFSFQVTGCPLGSSLVCLHCVELLVYVNQASWFSLAWLQAVCEKTIAYLEKSNSLKIICEWSFLIFHAYCKIQLPDQGTYWDSPFRFAMQLFPYDPFNFRWIKL